MRRRLLYLLASIVVVWNGIAFAQSDDWSDLQIIPEVDKNLLHDTQNYIIHWNNWTVRDRFNERASNLETKEQIVSGVMTRDTLLDYGAIVLKFLSQVWITIGAVMFIVVWYQYITSVISGSSPQPDLIRKAIIWVLVIIFSYAIMRILTLALLR